MTNQALGWKLALEGVEHCVVGLDALLMPPCP